MNTAFDLTDRELDTLCQRWAVWHREHGLIAPPIPKNILARMQPARVRPAPRVGLSAECSLLNTAITAQDDSPAKISFLIYYLHTTRSVKEAAAAQGVTRDAFYRRVRRFRRKAHRAMLALEAAAASVNVLHSGGTTDAPQSRARYDFAASVDV